jgi:hypothetical protein
MLKIMKKTKNGSLKRLYGKYKQILKRPFCSELNSSQHGSWKCKKKTLKKVQKKKGRVQIEHLIQ